MSSVKKQLLVKGVALALVCLSGASALAAEAPSTGRSLDRMVNAAMQYAFPAIDGQSLPSGEGDRTRQPMQLGVAAPTASPGLTVGNTWWDVQHNGRTGRMNETRTTTLTLARFAWTYMPEGAPGERTAAYTVYDFSTGTLIAPFAVLQPPGDLGGFVNLDVTNDNRAVVACDVREAVDGIVNSTIYWDFGVGWASFGYVDSVPAALSQYAGGTSSSLWPTVSYVEGTSDTITHVFAHVLRQIPGAAEAICYFRRVGAYNDPAAGWDDPPYVVDSVFNVATAIEGNDDGRVALAWIANVPCSDADPDTASCSDVGGAVQWNNDLYYQLSYDYGATWQPRVNLTKSRLAQAADIPHFQPYTDLSILLDTQGDLHIVWAAAYWPTGHTLYSNSRSAVLHWSEDVPYIRTAYDATWEPGDCRPGVWELTASKASISECQGRFYILFTQFNDRPNGVLDDCASGSNPGYPDGAANGDLYVSISADNGLTWSPAWNLTNSRTPVCDSVGGLGGPCDNDHWATMARFGDDHDAGAGVPVVVPGNGSGGEGFYLDVQYINDRSAGAAVQSEGYWQNADVKWFRMQCVGPLPDPFPVWHPRGITFPAWTKAGVTWSETVTITNYGNTDYTYIVAAYEDPGTLSGWLGYTGFSGLVPSGLNNTEVGSVVTTPVGANPGEIHHLTGRLVFTGIETKWDYIFEIDFIVADTLIPPTWDTIATACTPLALQVRSDGLFGGHDDTKGVGLDYYPLDCDTTATPYLYSGSPVIMWIEGTDTIANWTVFDNNYVTSVGFYPLDHTPSYIDPDSGQIFRSTFVTRDSSIAVEQTWFAPQGADTCNFVVRQLRISSNDGAAHNNLLIGEVVDWDIPSDSGLRNGSNYNQSLGLFWQFGGEYGQDDTTECQENDARFGAMKFVGAAYVHAMGATAIEAPYSAFSTDNPTYVYGNPYGLNKSELWENMTAGGWSRYISTDPDSVYTDLHMGMCFDNDYDLPATGALHIWTAYITIENGDEAALTAAANAAQAWIERELAPPICCRMRGDFNYNGSVQVSDLTAFIAFLFRNGPPPTCFEHGDVNADGVIDIRDLTGLIGFLFRLGMPPAPC